MKRGAGFEHAVVSSNSGFELPLDLTVSESIASNTSQRKSEQRWSYD